EEMDINDVTPESFGVPSLDGIVQHSVSDVGSVISSGSFLTDGMVICPCSSQTLGAVACGLGENLIHRAAHVTLKEMRRLVVVPREMPMSRIDLQNSLRLSEAGAVLCPAAPGFYLRPTTVQELVDFVAGKILDLLDVPHSMNTRWTGEVPAVKSS
ncbi:MAG: UbiX family flavin prenyltransferase, partial [Phycisphaerae bacterium]